MTSGPFARYEALRAEGLLAEDAPQRAVAQKIQDLHERLEAWTPPPLPGEGGGGKPWRFAFLKKPASSPQTPRGLYIWGGVGRGKTMLMDLFFEEAPVEPRRRVHFHAFMREIHQRLAEARQSGVADPVPPVARGVAESARLLCFDEMEVSDIADAMILGRLFEALFALGVVVVTTSNRHPADLYKDGLNRDSFKPFIALIQERMEVVELVGARDHRMAGLASNEAWFGGPVAEATIHVDEIWRRLTDGATGASEALRVQGRDVVIPRAWDGVARATFGDLCARPLGPADYLAIADRYHTLILERVPLLGPARRNEARRFITLVDVLYDSGRRLIISATGEPEDLYVSGDGAFEFGRTVSRLNEMRSAEWLETFADARAQAAEEETHA
ncbi:cell division protein ZapE [Neomegalonema sp.]|uniref:cell division protein ZapE n=1 Tax=Neomegalonema sp. TaxID=2039713 RepID=UPI0026190A9C|nr:cell division protein ZapE [Neomegalonema sp.]MDD2867653.1 cell division protein ZapE [Neomegalonema sp.]